MKSFNNTLDLERIGIFLGKEMSAQEWVRRANRRLKGCGISLELQGVKRDRLYMRGMFPGKPWEGEADVKKQTRIALKMKALTLDDVKRAETIARQVGLDLNQGKFDWAKFSDVEDPNAPPSTIGDFVKQFEDEKKPKLSDYTWRYSYQTLLDKLPLDKKPTEDLLMAWVLEYDPNASTMRRKYVSIAKSICKLADIPTKRLDKLAKENPTKPVNPRKLPTDEEIETTALSIVHPEWKWVYGMLATYGLRPHELFHLDLERFPDVRVMADTKTGERLVPPLYVEWVELFGLESQILIPSNLQWDEETPNWKRGRKVGNGFVKKGLGDPYNLRHCYARRCLESGMTSDVSAALMGHSRQIHEDAYRAFIHSSTYLEVAKRITASYKPPSRKQRPS